MSPINEKPTKFKPTNRKNISNQPVNLENQQICENPTKPTNKETNPNQNQSTLEFIFSWIPYFNSSSCSLVSLPDWRANCGCKVRVKTPVKTRCDRAFLQPPFHSISGSILRNPEQKSSKISFLGWKPGLRGGTRHQPVLSPYEWTKINLQLVLFHPTYAFLTIFITW